MAVTKHKEKNPSFECSRESVVYSSASFTEAYSANGLRHLYANRQIWFSLTAPLIALFLRKAPTT